MKDKGFAHVEQHFAPLDSILEGLKAEKQISVWTDQGLKERAVIITKTWLQKVPLEGNGWTKTSCKQENRNIPCWKCKKPLTFQIWNISFTPQKASPGWSQNLCICRIMMLDLNTENPVKADRYASFEWSGPWLWHEIAQRKSRVRKRVSTGCLLGLIRLLGSATGVWRCSWGLFFLSYRFLSGFNLFAANRNLQWS